MNDRLTIQDFTDLLAAKHSMNKKDAEAFVKEFFLLIEQALENEKYVKIKGLGTFKLIDVDSRESVNVNTGERFQIQEHSKVSFTPDGNLRDTINKPFSHFETVVLNEKTVLPDTPVEEMGEDGASDSAYDDRDLSSDLEDVNATIDHPSVARTESLAIEKEDKKEEDNFVPESSQENDYFEREGSTELNLSDQSEVTTQNNETTEERKPIMAKTDSDECNVPVVPNRISEEKRSAEEIIALELQKHKENSSKAEMLNAASPEEKVKLQSTKNNESKTHTSFLVAVIFIVLLICGGTLVYIYNPDLFSAPSNSDSIDMPVNEKKESIIPVLPDSTSKVNQIENEAQKVVNNNIETTDPAANKKSVDEKKVIDDKKAENVKEQKMPLDEANLSKYVAVGTKTTHKIKVGETLTKVSMQFYGSKAFWPFIVKYNRDVIKNPDNVPFGTVIKIPELAIKK